MKILNNLNDEQGHVNELCDCLGTSKKAYISVAFLKNSGLRLIMDQLKNFLSNDGELLIIAGQNFGLTEPEALLSLLDLLKNYPASKLYLYKAESADNIFHPKMYLFEADEGCKIILGSANMTKGGISSNMEISISIKCKRDSDIWKQAISTFDTYILNSIPATRRAIEQYKIYYDKQLVYSKKINSIPQKYDVVDCAALEKYLTEKLQKKLKRNLVKRKKTYRYAVEILDEIADKSSLTEEDFIFLLDEVLQRWYSRGLQREKTFIHGYYKEFATLVRYIRANKSKRADEVFSTAKKLAKKIPGVGVNYITEIMISYNSKDFAILNSVPFTTLTQKVGATFKHKNHSSFNGKDYSDYCNLIKEISEKLGLSDMYEADMFFYEVNNAIPK